MLFSTPRRTGVFDSVLWDVQYRTWFDLPPDYSLHVACGKTES